MTDEAENILIKPPRPLTLPGNLLTTYVSAGKKGEVFRIEAKYLSNQVFECLWADCRFPIVATGLHESLQGCYNPEWFLLPEVAKQTCKVRNEDDSIEKSTIGQYFEDTNFSSPLAQAPAKKVQVRIIVVSEQRFNNWFIVIGLPAAAGFYIQSGTQYHVQGYFQHHTRSRYHQIRWLSKHSCFLPHRHREVWPW